MEVQDQITGVTLKYDNLQKYAYGFKMKVET